MKSFIKRTLIVAGFACAMASGAWSQVLTPLGDFETAGSITAAGDPNYRSAGGGAGNPANFVDAATGPVSGNPALNGTRSAFVETTGGGLGNFDEQLTTSNYSQASQDFYTVSFNFQANRVQATPMQVRLTNGLWLLNGTNTLQIATFTGGLQTFSQRYIRSGAGSSNALIEVFDVAGLGAGYTFGNVAGDALRIDNFFVTVPELSASAATIPLVLLAAVLLLAYDRRKLQIAAH